MAEEAKLRGNELFKGGDVDGALSEYLAALKLCHSASDLKAALHKNAAACYLKKKQLDETIEHCSAALAHNAGDVKALFRRGQAYEQNGQIQKAFPDFARASKLDPKNKQVAAAAHRLMSKVSSKMTHEATTEGRSQDMLALALGDASAKDKLAATKNLVAIANDEPGAQKLFQQGFVDRVVPLLSDPQQEVQAAALRAYALVAATQPQRAVAILEKFASPELSGKLMTYIQSGVNDLESAAMHILHRITETLSSEVAGDSEPVKTALDKVVDFVIALIPHASISAHSRDLALTIVMRFAKCADFGARFLQRGGVKALVIAASCTKSPLAPADAQSAIAMSSETRMHVSIALSKIYEATFVKHKPSPMFAEECKSAITFHDDDPKSNVAPCYALTAVLQAVVDVGNQILEEGNILQTLMAMTRCQDRETQCAAAEAITHAASDTKRIKGIMTEAFGCLKALYGKNLPNPIRVRALVGLCKMGSMHGGAVNMRTLAEGATVNLAKKLRPFLVGEDTTLDIQRWAAEGLAYLTLDAEVKEYITADPAILKAVHRVCMEGEKTVRYSMSNLLANVTNSYDQPEETEERKQLKRLGKLAKESIPEPHPKDAIPFAHKRIEQLLKHNFVEALVELGKSDSNNTREQVSRVLLAFVEDQKQRGLVVQQGGAKALLPLARENTEKGLLRASQALAKLAITIDPSKAFPGQRTSELVKPLLRLMKERNGLLQFEGAMAMCNLASLNEEMRSRIVRAKGVKVLEDLMFDEDPMVRRAGTEAMVNMFSSEKVFEMFATPEGACWARVKLWILLSGTIDEDFPTARAAAGGLALLSRSKYVCEQIRKEKQGLTIIRELLTTGSDELYHRVLFVVLNMVHCSKELAEALCEEETPAYVSVIYHTSEAPQVKQLAQEVLEKLIEHGLVKSLEDTQRIAVEFAVKFQAEQQRLEKERAARRAEREGDDEEDDDEEDEEELGEEDVVDPDDLEELEFIRADEAKKLEQAAAAAAASSGDTAAAVPATEQDGSIGDMFSDSKPAILELDEDQAAALDV